MKPVRFTRGSRKHRIGRASARHVMDTASATTGADAITGDLTLTWVGDDERGRELEIVAIDKPDCYLVIHVMPTYFRRRNP